MHGSIASLPDKPRKLFSLPLIFRLAMRELRSGLRGFGIFLACIALGVAAIAGVSSLSRSLTEGLTREGRKILGADLAFTLLQRQATPPERAFLSGQGDLSSLASMRAMAVAAQDKGSGLVELKAVDGAYPTVGTLGTEPVAPVAELLGRRDGSFGGVVDETLLARLGLKLGDTVTVGRASVQLRAKLVQEPDSIASGIGFGPRLIVSQEALQATELLQPGSLVRWTYRLLLPPGSSDERLDRTSAEITKAFPEAGWDIRSRSNADPRFMRNIERFSQFLTLVGLTALLVGGVGVASAVRGFIDRKRPSIATLKSLGAPGGQVVLIYLTQILLIAAIGIAIGLAVGAALPFAVDRFFGSMLPIPLAPSLALGELAIALVYGALTAFVFAIGPLGRAHDIPVSGLFRDQIEPERRLPRPRYLALLVIGLVALAGLAVLAAYDRKVALIFLGATAGAFLLLRVVAAGVTALAKRLPRPRKAAPRLALANLHRPGALTPSLVLSLGLGITLLVVLAVTDSNLSQQLTKTLPRNAPSLFFLDIPNSQANEFEQFLKTEASGAKVDRVPMMRGRLVSLGGVPVAQIRANEEFAWVLDGDRGITYAQVPPEGSVIEKGQWWPQDYSGKPLVSFDQRIGEGLGLKLGDDIVVNVLGRNLTATIASFRTVEWRSLGINFVMVFSPNAFAGAPHTDLATLTLPAADRETELQILRKTAVAYPNVTSIRVKEALEAVDLVVSQLLTAIRGASAVALLASLLVLAGALAAGHRARLHDAVIFKTLGATRARLLLAYALEYGFLGMVTALFGLIAGTVTAFFIATRVMNIPFSLDLSGALLACALAVVVSVGLGLLGTLRILSQKPAPYLRDL